MMMLQSLILFALLSPSQFTANAKIVNAADSSKQGSFSIMAATSGVTCIHAALLPDNKLLCTERPHTSPYPVLNPNTNGQTSVIIDLSNPQITPQPTFLTYNAFCAGHAQAWDGTIFMAGGDAQDSNSTDGTTFLFDGRQYVRTYTPPGVNGMAVASTGQWTEVLAMATRRWYPTVVAMADGGFIIVSGDSKNIDFDHLQDTNNPTYEYFPPRFNGGTPATYALPILDWAFPHNLYPPMFQLPGGGIFLHVSNRSMIIDPTVDPTPANNTAYTSLPDMPVMDHAPWIYPHSANAFLLPMKEENNYTATVVLCGGSKNSTKDASAMCWSITPEAKNPEWKQLSDMPHARLMPDSAILPDGTILMVNGASWGQAGGNAGQCQYAAAPVFPADIYDPTQDIWYSTAASATMARLYHSGVVLLANGTAITVGSEMENYLDCWGDNTNITPLQLPQVAINMSCFPNHFPDGTNANACSSPYTYTLEVFTPAYIGQPNPPKILSAPDKATYDSIVAVSMDPTAGPVSRITLVRYSTTTHGINTDQRLLEPYLLFSNASLIVFKAPPNGGVAPPGNYHLFVLNDKNVPSVAAKILLGPGNVISSLPAGVTTTTRVSSSTTASTSSALVGTTTGSSKSGGTSDYQYTFANSLLGISMMSGVVALLSMALFAV